MVANLVLIINLFILEALLSVDNAAVLAVLVKDLPPADSKKALKWGIWGAYLLRGGCLFIATLLVSLWPLKVIGGGYLIYLSVSHWSKAKDSIEEDVAKGKEKSKLYGWLRRNLGLSELWLTIIMVEIMDLIFSIDNIFASVAISKQLWVILVGVFMGILAMRFVAMWFVKMLRKYPSLENSAYIVILLLGMKLILLGVSEGAGWKAWEILLTAHITDMVFSGIMMLIFFIPLMSKGRKHGLILDLANSVEDSLRGPGILE